MSTGAKHRNRVREYRQQAGWSQTELAARAGISRAAVSAIEGGRIVPSVSAALALARCFECSVERLFAESEEKQTDASWAWPPAAYPSRYWQAQVGHRPLLFPAETTSAGLFPHDGVAADETPPPVTGADMNTTLVLAGCDPAAALLADQYTRQTPFRLVPLMRSSSRALELLAQGLIHVAGVHLSSSESRRGNDDAVQKRLGAGYQLLRLADWEEGLAVTSHRAIRTVRSAVRSKLSWVGREAGSGAQQCFDELLPGKKPRFIVGDHRGVAEAVRLGLADAGVCLRLTCAEAGLKFLSLRHESYDLCFPDRHVSDPRVRALIEIVRSTRFRQLVSELPGYSSRATGECHQIAAK